MNSPQGSGGSASNFGPSPSPLATANGGNGGGGNPGVTPGTAGDAPGADRDFTPLGYDTYLGYLGTSSPGVAKGGSGGRTPSPAGSPGGPGYVAIFELF